MSMELIIGNLLIRHNCVILPDFGGFVAKKISAKIDYSNGVMYAPRKAILFNSRLINNDGLLINELARENALTYEQAALEVKGQIQSWKVELESGMRISLDKIGYLFLDAERNICFEQDRFFNLLMESYGLGKVHFVSEEDVAIVQNQFKAGSAEIRQESKESPIIQLVPAEKIVDLTSEQISESPVVASEARSGFKIGRYIAAAVILPLAFYTYWLPMETKVLESGMISLKDFNPFSKSQDAVYRKEELKIRYTPQTENKNVQAEVKDLPENIDVYHFQYDAELAIPVLIDKKSSDTGITENQTIAPSEVKPQPRKIESTAGSHLIVGCFSSLANAENLVKTLNSEGFDARIVDKKGGLHRVSAGFVISGSNIDNLQTQLNSKGYNTWILNLK